MPLTFQVAIFIKNRSSNTLAQAFGGDEKATLGLSISQITMMQHTPVRHSQLDVRDIADR